MTELNMQVNRQFRTGWHSFLLLLAISICARAQSPILGHAANIADGQGGAALKQASSVFVAGNYAYVTSSNNNYTLEVVDISNPGNPVHSGSLTHDLLQDPTSVYVVGNYAYLAGYGNSKLVVADVTDPTSPVYVGSLSDGQGGARLLGAYSVFVSGNYAYIASTASNALEIADVSDPTSPLHASSVTDGTAGASLNGPTSVYVANNYAYVASLGALEIVDVTIPGSPIHKSHLNTAGGNSVFVVGQYAYVASRASDALKVVDVSNPASPVLTGSISNYSLQGANSVYVVGNYAYVTSSGSGQFVVVDISNPALPAQQGSTFNVPYALTSLFVKGIYAYVTSGNSLVVVDVHRPVFPTAIGVLRDGTGGPYLKSPYGVCVSGNQAYVTCDVGLEIIDVSDPSLPVHKATLLNGVGGALLSNPFSVRVFGNNAYVASYGNNALEVIDVTDPASPSHKASLTNGTGGALLNGPTDLWISGGYAYIVGQGNALEIADISDQAGPPVHKGSLSDGSGGALLNGPYAIRVNGNYAYITSYSSNALEIVDVTNPAAPVHKSSLAMHYPLSLSLVGNLLYVTTNDNIVNVVDVSDPASPTIVGSLAQGVGGALLDGPFSVSVLGNYAYISCYFGDALDVIDVSNPVSPVHVASLADGQNGASFSSPRTVFASGNFAYVTNWANNSIEIVSLFAPIHPLTIAATSVSSTGFTAHWSGLSTSTSFQVDVSADTFKTYVSGYNNVTSAVNNLVVSGLNPATTYQFRVRGVNAYGISPNSNATSVTTVPGIPVATNPSSISQTSFTAIWNSVTGATGYYLDVATDVGFTAFVGGYHNLKVSDTSQVINSLTAGVVYQYRVRSYNASGSSLSSNSIALPTIPPAPTSSAASTYGVNSFNANWSTAFGAANYFIDVSSDNFGTFLTGYQNKSAGNVATLLVTGLSGGTLYQYRVRSSNVSGTSENSSSIQALTLPVAPVALAATSVGQSAFDANWDPVQGATGYYLDVATSMDFASILGIYSNFDVHNVTTANVNGLNAGTNYYYRIRAYNSGGSSVNSNVISSPTVGNSISTTEAIPTLSSGGTLTSYSMFSIPLVLQKDDSTINTVFSSMGSYSPDKWRLLRWNSSGNNWDEYEKGLSTIDRGKSYWFNSFTPASVVVTGVDFFKPSYKLNLNQGWNQIGSPYNFDISWADVLAKNASQSGVDLVENSLYKYVATSASFTQTDNLKAWSGAYVFNGGPAIALTIPSDVQRATGGRIISGDPGRDVSLREWFLPLTFKANELENSYAGLGMHPDARPSYDRFDGITVPRFINYLELNSHHPEFFEPNFARDIVPTSPSYNWHFIAESNFQNQAATLSWDSQALGLNESQLVLFDPKSGAIIDMKQTSQYSFEIQGPHLLHFFFATSKEHFKPDITMLAAAYPNPVQTSVSFPFFTAERGNVLIEVYDITGRRAKTITNETFAPGIHEMQWDCTDEQGGRVSSGVYIYRFISDHNLVQSGKLIVR